MSKQNQSVLRLVFPQWQGGNYSAYQMGSALLNFLAPQPSFAVEQVNVISDNEQSPLLVENGIIGREVLLKQADEARQKIDKHQPKKIVILGGDCLVDLVPFAYLNEIYNGDLAVLWLDAHPDVMTPEVFHNAHAMVLGNLLGKGDEDFVKRVKQPLKPENVMFAGLGKTLPFETDFIHLHNLKIASASALKASSDSVIDWLGSINAKYLAVHFNLDVLDVKKFHSIYFGNPDAASGDFDDITQGEMYLPDIVRLLRDVSAHVDIVGLGITEYLPWDAIALKDVLAKLPILRDGG
ncbi:arginase family protein [Bartonella sp. HY329]|uniref:arginase family protein n=1 Tax=unclassified Bartonella TaxID=2645622 RepID=UPI0021C9F3D1|nr:MULTISPECIES: arginase family protein [unclassified Bartonella]UXM94801.1 arginase family protein [Bartonella sp. HY329]UXN09124.1 arginase family protein [Bartonella sp. HY328]